MSREAALARADEVLKTLTGQIELTNEVINSIPSIGEIQKSLEKYALKIKELIELTNEQISTRQLKTKLEAVYKEVDILKPKYDREIVLALTQMNTDYRQQRIRDSEEYFEAIRDFKKQLKALEEQIKKLDQNQSGMQQDTTSIYEHVCELEDHVCLDDKRNPGIKQAVTEIKQILDNNNEEALGLIQRLNKLSLAVFGDKNCSETFPGMSKQLNSLKEEIGKNEVKRLGDVIKIQKWIVSTVVGATVVILIAIFREAIKSAF